MKEIDEFEALADGIVSRWHGSLSEEAKRSLSERELSELKFTLRVALERERVPAILNFKAKVDAEEMKRLLRASRSVEMKLAVQQLTKEEAHVKAELARLGVPEDEAGERCVILYRNGPTLGQVSELPEVWLREDYEAEYGELDSSPSGAINLRERVQYAATKPEDDDDD